MHNTIASCRSQRFGASAIAIFYGRNDLRFKALSVKLESGFALTIKEKIRCRLQDSFSLYWDVKSESRISTNSHPNFANCFSAPDLSYGDDTLDAPGNWTWSFIRGGFAVAPLG